MGLAAELETGEVFAGRYEVQQRLGEGDRKRTYLARDTKMDRLVAVSLVKPEAVLSDPDGTEREARVLGHIGSNANIVSLYDYEIDSEGSAQYMVFQYLGGGTLTEYLKDVDPLSLEDILRFARQLCRGLSHLHKGGSSTGTYHQTTSGSMSIVLLTSATSTRQSPQLVQITCDR